MGKMVTSIYVDDTLWKEAGDKGIDRSSIVEESLKKALNKSLTLGEINEKIEVLFQAIEELQKEADIIAKEQEAAKLKDKELEEKQTDKWEEAKQEKREKIREMVEKHPELKGFDMTRLSEHKYMFEFVTALRSKHPEIRIGYKELQRYFIENTSQNHTPPI
jgi:post-segregation antitoxin (ccd killing protein)